MLLRTLGKLEIDGVGLPNPKLLLLLCYLSLQGPQERSRLAKVFWPRSADPSNRLSVSLVRLRRALPGSTVSDRTHVWTPVRTDAEAVASALDANEVDRALDLYRAPFLRDLRLAHLGEELEEWLYRTRDDLAYRVQVACLDLADVHALQGRTELAVATAEAALSAAGIVLLEARDVHRLHALLIAGSSPHARRVRQDAAALGLTLEARPGGARAGHPSPRTGRAVPNNLERSSTRFVGREADLVDIGTALGQTDRRLVTLVGPGGIGKSRLALQVAHDETRLDRFPDGVFFVPLEELQSPGMIPESVVGALRLGAPAGHDPLDELVAFLRHRSLLLILDNFEQVVDGAEWVGRLLRVAPGLKVMVTSREPLDLAEEGCFAVRGLTVASGAAAELFTNRAVRTKFDFRLRAEDAAPLAAICRLTGGNPLALELAAAWVGVLSVADIAAEIGTNLDFLGTTFRDVPERHRSIRSVFEGSWRMLSAEEQAGLRRLAVFRGGFDREGAREVAGASLIVLKSLMAKSLIRSARRGHFERHPLLHRYAEEKLAARPEDLTRARRRHAEYFARLAEKANEHIHRLDGVDRLGRLESEHANLQAALRWTVAQGESGLLLRLCRALVHFWTWRGHHAEALSWLGELAKRADEFGDDPTYASCLDRLSHTCLMQNDFETAREVLDLSLGIHRRIGDRQGAAEALTHLGILSVWQGDYATAEARYLEGLAIARDLGHEPRISRLLNNMGDVFRFRGEQRSARRCYEESLELERKAGGHQMEANVLGSLGIVLLEEGDVAGARDELRESLRITAALGITYSLPTALEQLAAWATASGHPRLAARFWGAAEAEREATGTPMQPFDRPYHQSRMDLARESAGARAFDEAWQQGRRMPLEAAVDLGLARADERSTG